MSEKRYTVWRCPDCGEQITDPPERDPRTFEYKRGHYHDPPEGWWTDDGPGPENVNEEDPWFDAVEERAVSASDYDHLKAGVEAEVKEAKRMRRAAEERMEKEWPPEEEPNRVAIAIHREAAYAFQHTVNRLEALLSTEEKP